MRSLPTAVALTLFAAASVFAAEPNDPYYASANSWGQGRDDQWALKALGFTDPASGESAWAIENGSNNPIIVAVIDTGLDYYHPDLRRENIWRNVREIPNGIDDDSNGYVDDFIGWNFYDNDNNPWDFAGHGTHIAGIIAASTGNGEGVAGINWGARIMPLKVLNFVGRGRTTRIAEAIFYAVENGARVINLSLGGHHLSKAEQLAVDFAFKRNVVVVVASGNEGTDTSDYGPAGLENILTVGSTGYDGKRAPFSNWGTAVDVMAPGIEILSLRARWTDFAMVSGQPGYEPGAGFVGPGNRYYRATGTSFSAPLATGVASLLVARNPDLTAGEIMRIIRQTARDIDVPGIDRNTGYGMIDARAALQADPGFFVEAAISGVNVIQADGRPWIRVLGTADADKFDKAWIEIGAGEDPAKWKKVSDDLSTPVREAPLDDLNVTHFQDAKTWTLRLIVEHENGKRREARFVLNLG